jgi:hypothetical protein
MKQLLLAPMMLAAALAAGPAFAGHDHDDGDRAAKREKFCQENPAKCEEVKARRDAFCKDNPQTCEKKQQERADRKKWCADNPQECQRMKEERHERREKIRENCEANPEKCKERRQEFRERRKERSEAFCKEHPQDCDGQPDGNEREPGPPR